MEATQKQINYAIRLRDERQAIIASRKTAASKIAFNAFVIQLSDLLTQPIRGRQDPTWRHYRYVADGTNDRKLIERRIRDRYTEIGALSDEQIAALDHQEINHLIDDLKGGI